MNRLCDENERLNQKKMTKITVDTRSFKELHIGKSRDQLKEEICPEAAYDQKADQKLKER